MLYIGRNKMSLSTFKMVLVYFVRVPVHDCFSRVRKLKHVVSAAKPVTNVTIPKKTLLENYNSR